MTNETESTEVYSGCYQQKHSLSKSSVVVKVLISCYVEFDSSYSHIIKNIKVMTQYIDKSAIVAEINQRIEDYKSHKIDDSYHDGLIFALEDLRDDFLDTLEVKEVDLEKELSYEDYMGFFKEHPNFPDDWGFDECWVFAKYFFELGLKAQKGG